MKKKGFLVLLFALICLVSVGCGKDDDDDKKSSKKSNERTLKCTTEEDSGKMIVNITQDKKSYEFTKGSVSMTMDISSYGEAAKGMDWESMFCESFKDEMPSKTCKAAVDGNNLSIDIEKTNPLTYDYNYMYIREFDRYYFIDDISMWYVYSG